LNLKEKIMANIELFAISDFCPNGGWPKFDNLSIIVYNEDTQVDSVIYDVELMYVCEFAGCCFIPGGENFTRLRKKIEIKKTSFIVLD
jgi:hypothetical protein